MGFPIASPLGSGELFRDLSAAAELADTLPDDPVPQGGHLNFTEFDEAGKADSSNDFTLKGSGNCLGCPRFLDAEGEGWLNEGVAIH